MTLSQNFWDISSIVIALDFLYQDFDTTTTCLLEIGDQTINEIQSIL